MSAVSNRKNHRLSTPEILAVDKWMIQHKEQWQAMPAAIIATAASAALGFTVGESSIRAIGTENGYTFGTLRKPVAYVVDDKLRTLLAKLASELWDEDSNHYKEFFALLDS